MRIKVWDRLLCALGGLLIAALGVLLGMFGLDVLPFELSVNVNTLVLWQRAVIVAVAVCLVALGLHGISLLLRRGREKGFIIQHTEYGDMSISMKAMESMVQKCVDAHQELSVTSTRIYRRREGVVVEIRIMLAGGVNIPLTVNALQKQIKQYITSCSGVDVHKVRVMVETDAARLVSPETATGMESPAAEPDRHATENLFRHAEEPASYAPAAVETAVEEPQSQPAAEVEAPAEEPAIRVEEPASDAEAPEIVPDEKEPAEAAPEAEPTDDEAVNVEENV